jgi:ubiquinone/menaquinone biosynthesis C-methylase UbiE
MKINYKHYHEYLLKESLFGFIYRRFILYPILKLLTGNEFLDVGCGVGIFLSFGSKKSIGLDINPYNIKKINSKGDSKAYLINKDGTFPLKDSSIKTIICDQVIEHIDDPNMLLSEISRVIKKKGKIIIGLPMEKGFKSDPDHKRFYGIKNIKEITSKFEMKYIFHFYFPLFFKIFGKFFTWQYMYVILKSTK